MVTLMSANSNNTNTKTSSSSASSSTSSDNNTNTDHGNNNVDQSQDHPNNQDQLAVQSLPAAQDQMTAPLPPYQFGPGGVPRLHWGNGGGGARSYRRRVTKPPKIAPDLDPTIAAAEVNRETIISRMVQAVWSQNNVKDNLSARERNMFTIGSNEAVDPYEVEAACRSLCAYVLDRCTHGYRGPEKENRAIKPRLNCDADRDGNCQSRINNVIAALTEWKAVCRDILYEDFKMILLANAPLAYTKSKVDNQNNNRTKKRQIQKSRETLRKAKEEVAAVEENNDGDAPKRGRPRKETKTSKSGTTPAPVPAPATATAPAPAPVATQEQSKRATQGGARNSSSPSNSLDRAPRFVKVPSIPYSKFDFSPTMFNRFQNAPFELNNELIAPGPHIRKPNFSAAESLSGGSDHFAVGRAPQLPPIPGPAYLNVDGNISFDEPIDTENQLYPHNANFPSSSVSYNSPAFNSVGQFQPVNWADPAFLAPQPSGQQQSYQEAMYPGAPPQHFPTYPTAYVQPGSSRPSQFQPYQQPAHSIPGRSNPDEHPEISEFIEKRMDSREQKQRVAENEQPEPIGMPSVSELDDIFPPLERKAVGKKRARTPDDEEKSPAGPSKRKKTDE